MNSKNYSLDKSMNSTLLQGKRENLHSVEQDTINKQTVGERKSLPLISVGWSLKMSVTGEHTLEAMQ